MDMEVLKIKADLFDLQLQIGALEDVRNLKVQKLNALLKHKQEEKDVQDKDIKR